METLKFTNGRITAVFDPSTLTSVFTTEEGRVWKQDQDHQPYAALRKEDRKEPLKLLFSSAKSVSHKTVKSGPYIGVRSTFSDFELDGAAIDLAFETFIWIDKVSPIVHFELIPIRDEVDTLQRIYWPSPIDAGDAPGDYAALPLMQGMLVYNSDDIEAKGFDSGRVFGRGSIMPWFGQTAGGAGYLFVYDTPYDAATAFSHKPGAGVIVRPAWSSSLGSIGYRREARLTFSENAGYVSMCKEYRRIVFEKGELVTLREKSMAVPAVAELPGIPIIHTSFICWHCEPTSVYFDKEHPENNHKFRPFSEIADNLEKVAALGLKKAYIHIDGWGKRGYDNLHPDVLPPCAEAGGTEGMRDMLRRIRAVGFIPAIHDQYRDYYLDGETYDYELAIRDNRGNSRLIEVWPGGSQHILCAQVALPYIKRNYMEMEAAGIRPDGAYLDTFAAVDPDECAHPEHRMTRRECMEKRAEGLDFIRSLGMIASSEEPIGCLVPNMDMVHHGPYIHAIWGEDKGKPFGVPVPLFNLVYHDCLVTPWGTGMGGWGIPPEDSNMLHGMLNGGMPYLSETAVEDDLTRLDVMLRLNNKVAFSEMTSHEFVDGNPRVQKSVFSDGTKVTVDFDGSLYAIEWADGSAENGGVKDV